MVKKQSICCVCKHSLDSHISEEKVWRCHQLGEDCFQCECVLRKDRAKNKISYYDFNLRIKEFNKQINYTMKKEGVYDGQRKGKNRNIGK